MARRRFLCSCAKGDGSQQRHRFPQAYNYYRDLDPATGRYVESDPTGLGGGVNTYSYVGMNPNRFADPFGLSEQDVTNIVTHVNENFPEIHVNGGWTFGRPNSGSSAHSSVRTGQITLDEKFKKECLTSEEFFQLYFDYFHEAMHSTDPFLDRLTDAMWGGRSTTNHQRIFNREEYEQHNVLPPKNGPGMWGYGASDPVRPAVSDNVQKLYEETRTCGCKGQ